MNLSQEEWATQLAKDNNAAILDVRTKDEWNEGIIAGAILIDIYKPQEFMARLEAMDRSKNYYVYCKAGGRSQQACQIMRQIGFDNTYNLVGGMSHWNGEVVSP